MRDRQRASAFGRGHRAQAGGTDCSRSPGCRAPHAECSILAAHRLGVSPISCIAFEDSRSGVAAAVLSGALCIGIGDDAELTEAGAHIDNPNFVGICLQYLSDYLRRRL